MQPASPPNNPTAVVGRRILGWLIDATIGGLIVVVVLVAAVFPSFEGIQTGSLEEAETVCDRVNEAGEEICIPLDDVAYVADDDSALLWLLGAWVGATVILTMILPGLTGWSPGKLVTGLRIVKQETFERAGFGANLLRGLLWIVDAIPYGLPVVGAVVGLATKGHRRVGDMAARTLVVRKADVGRPVSIPGVNRIVGGSAGPPPPPSSLGPIPAPEPPSSLGPIPAPQSPSSLEPIPAPEPPSVEPAAIPASPDARTPQADEEHPTEEATPTEPTFEAAPMPQEEPAPPAEPSPQAEQAPQAEPTRQTEPAAQTEPTPPAEKTPQAEPAPAFRAGIDAPQWDEARDTYIQWDPQLEEWMEWSESRGRWIPISR